MAISRPRSTSRSRPLALLDAGAGDTDVVATFHVVVVVAGLADEDVVALERCGRRRTGRAVALEQVGLRATLHPVVTAIAEHGVDALTGDDEVVAGADEGLVGVGSTVGEVDAVARHDDVEAEAAVDGVVARTTLGDVVTSEVGDDVVAVTAEGDVVAVVAFDDVVAFTTPEGVVVVAAAERSCTPSCRCRRPGR